MPIERTFVLEATDVGHHFHDVAWEVAEPAYIEHWITACEILKKRKLSCDGQPVTVSADWRPIVRRRKRDLAVTSELEKCRAAANTGDLLSKFSRSKVRVNLCVAAGSGGPSNRLSSYAKSIVYDAYLMMNLAAPGSLNLHDAVLKLRPDKKRGARARDDTNLSLSNLYFATAWLDRHEVKWPTVKFLPLSDVACWYAKVRSDASQVPRSRMEKVLFSLLHLSLSADAPATIIWLFYGLETLYGTRPGENLRALVDRAQLLMLPDDRQRKYLKTNIRKLYDIRNSFVHGGMEVIHPMHDEVLDTSVDEKWSELSRACEFGFRLLLASIQSTIEKGWIAPKFREILEGEGHF